MGSHRAWPWSTKEEGNVLIRCSVRLQDQLIQEAHTMRGLAHPNLLRLHCSFLAGERLWLVTPFVRGGSLAGLLATRFPQGLDEEQCAVLAREILTGLAYLHARGCMHRDVKARPASSLAQMWCMGSLWAHSGLVAFPRAGVTSTVQPIGPEMMGTRRTPWFRTCKRQGRASVGQLLLG